LKPKVVETLVEETNCRQCDQMVLKKSPKWLQKRATDRKPKGGNIFTKA